jgi:hypothetical protein
MQRLQSLRHLTVQELPTEPQQPGVGHLAHPVVHERESLADGAQHLPSHRGLRRWSTSRGK